MERQSQTSPSRDEICLCIEQILLGTKEKGLYRELFEAANEAIMVFDRDMGVVLANDVATKIYGEDPASFGSKCWEVFHAGAASCGKPEYDCWIRRVIKTGKSLRTVTTQSLNDGQTIQVAVSASPVRDEEQKVRNVVVVLRDVTLEVECQKIKDAYFEQRQLCDQAPEGVFAVDAAGIITSVNERWLTLFGYSREEVIGKVGMCDLTTQDQHHLCELALQNLEKGLNVQCAEMEFVRKDGTRFWARAKAMPADGGEGPQLLGIVSIREISDTPLEAEKLGEANRFTKALLDSMGEGVLVLDTDYRIVETNKRFMEITEKRSEDIIGQYCYKVSHNSDVPCWLSAEGEHECPSKIAIETGKPVSFVHVHYDEHTRKHFVDVRAFPLKNDEGEVFQVIETHTDITDRKNLEDRLLQAQKMESLGTMAGGIAHDLNNILTPIIGNAELAMATISKENPLHNFFQEIHNAAGRAAALVRHILAFSRRQLLDKKTLSLNPIVQNLYGMLKRVIHEDIQLELCLDEDLWQISADQTQIEQIIINLAVNARDAMPKGGRLIIETQNSANVDNVCHTCGEPLSGSYVLLMVSDSGVGIDPKVINHIFDPFFTTKELGKGTGMGLSTIMGIMHQHNGHVNVYSEPGLGSTFKVYFPKHQESPGDEAAGPGGGIQAGPATGSETILVVDDDSSVRDMVARILERFGYTVLSAANGEKALEIFEQNSDRVALVLTDIVMPGMGGTALMERIEEVRAGVPVIFMSGYSLNAIHHKFVLKKGIICLPKPPSMEELLEKVRSTIDRTGNKG